MMKKSVITLCLLCVSMIGLAQYTTPTDKWHDPFDIYVGPKLGATYSKFTKLENDPMIWPTVGGFVQVHFTDRFGMNVEMSYSHQGGKNLYNYEITDAAHGPYEYRLDYINTEYKLKYYFTKSICVFTGFHFGTLINAKSEFNGISTNIRKNLHKIASIPIGASFETEKWMIEGYYCFPLNKVGSKSITKKALGDAKQNLFVLNVGYKIKVF